CDAREAADQELERLGTEARAALRKALAGAPSAELKRRGKHLLDRIAEQEQAPLSAETVRLQRALEVLEDVGSDEAKRVLEGIAAGDPNARLTQEARSALDRLGQKAGLR